MSTFLFLRGKGRKGRRRDWVEGDKKKFAEFDFRDVMMMMLMKRENGTLETCKLVSTQNSKCVYF